MFFYWELIHKNKEVIRSGIAPRSEAKYWLPNWADLKNATNAQIKSGLLRKLKFIYINDSWLADFDLYILYDKYGKKYHKKDCRFKIKLLKHIKFKGGDIMIDNISIAVNIKLFLNNKITLKEFQLKVKTLVKGRWTEKEFNSFIESVQKEKMERE